MAYIHNLTAFQLLITLALWRFPRGTHSQRDFAQSRGKHAVTINIF